MKAVRGKCNRPGARRAGKLLILFGALTPMLVGGMALSVDSGVKATARAQMQTAADSAALAAARQLSLYRNPNHTNFMTAQARASAIALAGANRILGTPSVLLDNPDNTTSGELVVGFLDPSDTTTPIAQIPNTTKPALEFNAVKVRIRRDASHGGAVPGFFGSVLGFGSSSFEVASVARMQNYLVRGFTPGGMNANLLPIVLDKATYDAMLAGTTTDQYTWDDISKKVDTGGDGVPESKLYPVKNGNPGNWGTVKIGVSNNSTSTLGAQIRYGITPQQLGTFPNGEIRLDSSLSPPSITFEGNPGISAGIKDDLTSIIGRPSFIPVYDQTGGNGNNAWYRVVKFAGVRIVSVNFQGNPKYVIVQPALVTDPTGIAGNPEPTLANGGLVRLRLAR
jgi:Flp pilus assembly protein TadG